MNLSPPPQKPESSTTAPAGIYIHIPFCRAKCPYCDFYSVTSLDRVDRFIDALLAEIKMNRQRISGADTVYFGGGTPSILPPGRIGRLLEGLHTCFTLAADAEVTLEVNPGTVNRKDLADFQRAGINRLNIGLQSIDDRTLAFLGRIHSAQSGIDTFRRARQAGFDNVGLDTIYAVPGQTVQRWEKEMAGVVRLEPDHLSCYSLTIEPGTPMARQMQDGRILLPDETTTGDLFSSTADFLNGNGYRQYEVSNFARRSSGAYDRRSRHNRKYWTFAPYLGFGPSAHSYKDCSRWWNHRHLDDYLAAVKSGIRPVADEEALTRDQQIMEFVYLGLRQTDGFDTSDFRRRFETDFYDAFGEPVSQLVDEGMLEKSSGRIRLTRQGMRFLESVVGRLLA